MFLSKRSKGILSLCGGVLIHLTLGTLYTFGNINPYVTSYLRSTSSPTLLYSDSMWIFSLSAMMQGATMLLGGFLHKRLSARWTCLIGSIIFSSAVSMTYFAIQKSFAAVILTYGLLFGIGIGIAYAIPMNCAMKWFPSRRGLVNGVIVSGFGAGSVIFDQVQTVYINPKNFKPNITAGPNDDKYFGQETLLNRVPSMFLLLGGVYAAMQLIGVILLNEPCDQTKMVSSHTSLIISGQEDGEDEVGYDSMDHDPRSVLKEKEFWKLWFMFLVNSQAVSFISILYKSYGETFISDDHFLALVGSFAAVFNGAGRIFWGYLADRYNFRLVMLVQCSLMAFLLLTFKLTEMAGSSMYLIWICLMFGTFSGNYSIFPTVTAKLFGQKHFTVNYGLLFTSLIVGGLVSALATQHLSGTLGWTGLFILIAGFSMIGFILAFFLKAKKPNGEDF